MADQPATEPDAADISESPDASGHAATPPIEQAPPDLRPRPMIERIGLALIAFVLAALFGLVSVASFIGGEPFLGVMGAIGCLMVVWVGALTLFRG